MINANELRIGNLVRTGEYHNKITSLGTDACHTTARDRVVLHTYEFVHPIPLSPEVLEKCGFEKQEDGDGGYYHELLSDNGVLFVEGDKKGYTDVFIDCWENIRVRYLHQLQNLYFALTSQELTIKL